MVLKVLLIMFLKHNFIFWANKVWQKCINSYECTSDCCARIPDNIKPVCVRNNKNNENCIGENA